MYLCNRTQPNKIHSRIIDILEDIFKSAIVSLQNGVFCTMERDITWTNKVHLIHVHIKIKDNSIYTYRNALSHMLSRCFNFLKISATKRKCHLILIIKPKALVSHETWGMHYYFCSLHRFTVTCPIISLSHKYVLSLLSFYM